METFAPWKLSPYVRRRRRAISRNFFGREANLRRVKLHRYGQGDQIWRIFDNGDVWKFSMKKVTLLNWAKYGLGYILGHKKHLVTLATTTPWQLWTAYHRFKFRQDSFAIFFHGLIKRKKGNSFNRKVPSVLHSIIWTIVDTLILKTNKSPTLDHVSHWEDKRELGCLSTKALLQRFFCKMKVCEQITFVAVTVARSVGKAWQKGSQHNT
jgi:hypothetical protein